MDGWLGISKAPRESMMKAIKLEKAISLDENHASAHAYLGFLYVQIGEYEKGIEGEQAIEIAPNLADAHAYLTLDTELCRQT